MLRMDHHCPWVANCIGHNNYGHFLRFLYSVDVTMALHTALLVLRVLDWWNPSMRWREPSTMDMVVLILNFAQGVPVLLMVGLFSMYHTYALCTNTTTIEGWEKDKVAMLVRRGKIEEVSQFPLASPARSIFTAASSHVENDSTLRYVLPTDQVSV